MKVSIEEWEKEVANFKVNAAKLQAAEFVDIGIIKLYLKKAFKVHKG